MKKIIITFVLLISFNFVQSQENYKSLVVDFMSAQGQFETFNATIDQMASMMALSLDDSEKELLSKKPYYRTRFKGGNRIIQNSNW